MRARARIDGVDIEFPTKIFADGISGFDELIGVADRLATFLADGELTADDCKKVLEKSLSEISNELKLTLRSKELFYREADLRARMTTHARQKLPIDIRLPPEEYSC